jgi:CRP-like cAMP-binding protein
MHLAETVRRHGDELFSRQQMHELLQNLRRHASRRTATVAALDHTETLAVYKDDFEQLRREHLRRQTAVCVPGRRGSTTGRAAARGALPAIERRVLRRLDELTAKADDKQPLEVPLTQEELAELAGTTRSTVNRILRDEAKRGTIKLERGRTIVLDREQIARRAR